MLITENLVDQAFLDKYCVGYDDKTLPAGAPKNSDYKSYILGKGPDKTAKTPAWAAKICGVTADTIARLAREIGDDQAGLHLPGLGHRNARPMASRVRVPSPCCRF